MMQNYGVRGFGVGFMNGTYHGRNVDSAGTSASKVETEGVLSLKEMRVQDVDGHANLDVGFVPNHYGKMTLSILNRGQDADPENYVEANIELTVSDAKLQGRGSLLKPEHGFNAVTVTDRGDNVLIRAQRGDETREFIFSNGYISNHAGDVRVAFEKLYDPDHPIDLIDAADFIVVGGITVDKNT